MKPLKIAYWIVLLTFSGSVVKASEILVSKRNDAIKQDIVFERFMSNDGLPDDRIRSIYQDSTGFLWIGTMNGLCKYDGYTFTKYFKTQHSNSISGNWTFSICEDSMHHIWIGTLEGLNCFDTKRETFTSYRHNPSDSSSLLNDEIYSVRFDKYGKLWIGTPKGLARFDPGKEKFVRFDRYPLNTGIGKIISSGDDDYIWITTSDGVVHYNVTTGNFRFFRIDVKPTPFGERFWSMLEDGRDLYIATGSDGLIKLPYNHQTSEYDGFVRVNHYPGSSENLENTQVFDICKSRSGNIWLGTEKGLAKIEGMGTASARLVFYKNSPINSRSISNNSVYKVFIDRTDVLWCGTELGLNKSDLNLLSFRHFSLTDQLSKEQVRNIYSQNGVDIWLGTAKTGFFHYNTHTGATQYYRFDPQASSYNSTRSIMKDKHGQLWLGTLGGSLKINGSSYTKEIDGATYAFMEDTKGNLWIGTNNGLYSVNAGYKRRYLHHEEGQSDNRAEFIRTVYEDHQGNIWCGFENRGFYHLDPGTGAFTRILEDADGQKIFGSTIVSILEYPRNVIWVGSESGLNKIVFEDDNRFQIKNYAEENGLSDKSINGILPDSKGNLWISTIKGLLRFNIEKETFEPFLVDFNFSVSCYDQSDNHLLLFGADDGFIVFDPDEVSVNQFIPKVVLTDFKLFNQSVSIGDTVNGDVILQGPVSQANEITLNYRNNVFSINFAALHFSNPEKCKYAYQLKGFDPDWVPTNAENRIASYTNLNAGTYTFMVKAANNSGIWNESPVELKIVILPPPWKTWWAYIIYCLTGVTVIYIVIRYYLTQMRQRHQIEIEKQEKEQLQYINQMKLKFFTDVAHEFRTPLMLISGPVEELLAIKDIPEDAFRKIKMVHKNAVKLNHLIDELMTFRKIDQNMLALKAMETDVVSYMKDIFDNFQPTAERKNVDFRFATQMEEWMLWMDREKLEKVFHNLLSNAFKFTKEHDVISIRISGPGAGVKGKLPDALTYIRIEVEDSGKGLSPDDLEKVFERFYQTDPDIPGTGIGLSLAKSLVELHHGTITVESKPNEYTRFNVYLPLGDQHLNDNQKYKAGSAIASDTNAPVLLEDSSLNPVPGLTGEVVSDDELLIVDDHPEVLDFLVSLFDKKYRIRKATNGQEALDLIQSGEPALVISDIMMPVMDGIELCRRLKTNIETCHIPLILLTAKSAVEHAIEGIGEGADDYVSKPFHPDLLRVRVDKMIESRKRMIEKFRTDHEINVGNIARNKIDQEFVQKIMDHVIDHIHNEQFGVEELGAMAGMSRSNLFRKLKAITGQTPVEFMLFIRMNHSMKLLSERRLNISEIAYEVGFQNPSSFTKAFRKQYGFTPSEFLKK